MAKKKIIIVTGNKYPNEDPGAVRQHVFAKMFLASDYEPIVIGMGRTTHFKEEKYDNVCFYSLRYESSSLFFRILGRLLFTVNLKRVLKLYNAKEIAAILMVSGEQKTFTFVKKYANKNSIQLIHDSVEWYSPSEFVKGERDREYIRNNDVNTRLIDKSYKVIAISTYLEKYFKKKGNYTVRIPVVLDINEMPYSYECVNDVITIVYAGNMAGKDQIQDMISALVSLPNEIKNKFKFKLFGVTYEQFKERYGTIIDDDLGNSIVFFGRVPREQIGIELRDADFTVLMRPSDERYAKAGFPTKVVESLAAGTPVICNYSSDLEMYLKHEVNSIILSECSQEECCKKLLKIAGMDILEIQKMKRAARETAECEFDWKKYVSQIYSLLD